MTPTPHEPQADLALAVDAWRAMFGEKLPADETQMTDELFYQASEQANVVTLVVRRHGFAAFRSALEKRKR